MFLSKEEVQVYLALAAVDGVGNKTLHRLLKWREQTGVELGTVWQTGQWPEGIFFNKQTSQAVSASRLKYSPKEISNHLEKLKITPIFLWEKRYPKLLKETSDAPLILYCKGKLDLLTVAVPIAVVGARRMTAYGKKATSVIAKELAHSGATIVSGFMYGVDVTAHLSALGTGGGSIAVLGFGLDQMYPVSQTELYLQLLNKNMLFISQFPLGTQAKPGNFLQRNAVVAGLSHAVVVTEAGFPSGSFSTAQSALDEGRLVCAVPGPFDSEYSQGTKWLINEGAVLVTAGHQVLEELGFPIAQDSHGSSNSVSVKNLNQLLALLSPTQKLVFNQVIEQGGSMEKLVSTMSLTQSQLVSILTELELLGLLIRVGETWQIAL